MSAEQERTLSVIEPIEPALERVKVVLFKPFDLDKWFTIGFCAWLARLGRGGFNFRPFIDRFHEHSAEGAKIHSFIEHNLMLITAVGLAAFILGLAIFIVLLWLSSRGRFMFVHCVAGNKAEVKVPWGRYKRHGNSLFLFQLVVICIFFIIFMLLCAAIIIPFVILRRSGLHTIAPAVIIIAFGSLIMISLLIVFAVVMKFTKDFAVPIMYLRSFGCVDAWRELLGVISVRKSSFVLYILFQIVIFLAIGAIIAAAMLVTCCCAACIIAIPYIGTVLLLPLLVFQRSYSLYYMAQLGPQYNIFQAGTAHDSEANEPVENNPI